MSEPLSAEEIGSVRRLHPDGACDHAYSGCREAQWLATLDAERAASERPPVDPLREAAQAVVNGAEPDDNFDGEFIEYLVSFGAIEALRAALASQAAPVATLHTCWDNHEGPDGTHADGSPGRDKATPLYAAVPPEGRLTGRDVHREWRGRAPHRKGSSSVVTVNDDGTADVAEAS